MSAGDDMGVTGNAQLLLGYIAALLMVEDDRDYEIVDVNAVSGSQVVRNCRSGNTYRISVVQLEGVE